MQAALLRWIKSRLSVSNGCPPYPPRFTVAAGMGEFPVKKILALSATILLAGCASVTRGTTENLSISSTPSGAQADVTGLDAPTSCVTPCAIVVKRNADISVAVHKDGYEPQIVPLTKEISGGGAAGFAGNILLGGLIGAGVDAYNGAAMDHKPNPVIVTLQPSAPPPPPRRSPKLRHKPSAPVS